MRHAVALVQSVFDSAVREINALEGRIKVAEADADAMLWEQARQVVAQLDAGLSQRALAVQWINADTGKSYDEKHVRIVKKVWEQCGVTPQTRPRFRDAYNRIANVSGKVNRLLHQTGDVEWYSPPDVVEAARAVLGAIDLDPASCEVANTVVQAARFYTIEDNGLEQPWFGHVFLNPPYRQPDIEQFCEKFAGHVAAGDIRAGIVLVNNCTDTEWFSTLATAASAFCFPSARCCYWQPDRTTSTALQGQVVVYAGPDVATFIARFSTMGLVLVRP
jgi:hypothetical protein